MWEVIKYRSEFEICPKCGSQSNTRCGKVSVTVREAPLRDKPLWLKINKHRYFCKSCRKPFTEPVNCVWPKRRTTHQFRKAIANDCENFENLSRVRERHRCSNGFIYKIHYELLKTKLNELKGISWPTVLGIDEHFFSRRNGYTEFTTVFTDLQKRRLFEMCLGKDKKSIIEQVKHIPGRDQVKVVVIDMSNGYRSLVKEFFPNAVIVADKFHMLRLITPALLKKRKEIYGHRQDLQQRRLLLKNREDLDYFVRSDIDKYLSLHPELNELYRIKERLREVYRCKGYKKAKVNLERLIDQMKSSKTEAVQRLKNTLIKWKEEVLSYFENKWTNGFTEAINGTAKAIQRRARGYKNFVNYRLKTLNACFY
ncbi:MAG TPA: ISL3 family transposase [Pseudobdellovibrionaceae bacterium]|nr:ISL3 family transposase [Pseudobdellovibrionaceae bacterium]